MSSCCSHNHHDASSMSEAGLKAALVLTFGFVIVEALAAARAHSLALLSDAGHNFTDAVALVISWYAVWIARKPASATRTYGHHRAGILAALFNAVTLLVIAGFILLEAYRLAVKPPTDVQSVTMMAVAAIAVAMNGAIAIRLHGHAAHDVNMRGAFLHMLGDALSSAGVIVAGAVIHFTGWTYADPLVSALIAVFIAYTSLGIVRDTVNILLEGTPRGLDVRTMTDAMLAVPGVDDVHDLHVWAIAENMNSLSCHLQVKANDLRTAGHIVHEVKHLLAERFSIRHSTIETECPGCGTNDLYCDMKDEAGHVHADPAPRG